MITDKTQHVVNSEIYFSFISLHLNKNLPYADSTLRLFLPCLELLCTNMLSEQANIPATGSGEEETCT